MSEGDVAPVGGGEAAAAPAVETEEEGAPKAKRPKWLPLESNPEVLNSFMKRVGVKEGFCFKDVPVVDEESLLFEPKPCLAVVLCFPTKRIRRPRLEALEGQQESKRAPASAFYLIQHKEFGNACGTIAAVHAMGNLARGGLVELAAGGAIEGFLLGAAGKSPEEAGHLLAATAALHEASDDAARSEKAQTRTPERDEKVDNHFVVFLEVEGRMVELDGCMGFPIDHGATSPDGLIFSACKVIREDFFPRDPAGLFNVMALVPEQAAGQVPELMGVDVESEIARQVPQLVAMGFDEARAREALLAAGGNLDTAMDFLCG